ncbi:MAG: ribose transport system ATP-binding protein [Rhodospirillaceae bacterium]|nr:ribose transport system ATP-binding protein [Rhodospirillaceae bacterium]
MHSEGMIRGDETSEPQHHRSLPRPTGNMPASLPALESHAISKSFSGTKVLNDISLKFMAGKVHVLFGENGAGKSTFINILSGALQPDSGAIDVAGQRLPLRSVHEARALGIATVFQEFSLSPDLTVEDNLVLGNEPARGGIWLDQKAAHRQAVESLSSLGFKINPLRKVRTLSRAEQQMVEITKALLTKPRVLILDEPTASLTDQETRRLFALIARLKSEGVAIIYISHRLAEIMEIGDLVSVLRDGHLIKTMPLKNVGPHELVETMIGRPLANFFPTMNHKPGDPLLMLNGLGTEDGILADVDIEVRAGEIVGLAGLVGCGKSQIARACYGLVPGLTGELTVHGQRISNPTPRKMLGLGVAYVPADRRREGLLLTRPVEENITLSVLGESSLATAGFLRSKSVRQRAGELVRRMLVRPARTARLAGQYSGGNQQKIVLGKVLARSTEIVILDEPTVGVDVGAKAEIYGFMADLIAHGAAVLLISSDLPEIINLCNRVYVIHDGRVRTHMERGEISEEALLHSFFSEPDRALRGNESK